MQRVAVRWQSKTFCKNIACRVGTTIGLLSPARESWLAVCVYIQSMQMNLTKKIVSVAIPLKSKELWIINQNF